MEKNIYLFAILLAAVMSILLFAALTIIGKKERVISKGNRRKYENSKLSSLLEKSGLSDKMTASSYRIMQIILSFAGFFFSLLCDLKFLYCIVTGTVLFFLPNLILKKVIKDENRKMLSDIEHIYNLLHLQNCAGAYFSDSLVDCYMVVSNKRLKDALIKLVGEINGKIDVRIATETFANQFDNPYLTTLAGIIRHGVEDGNTDAMLQDVIEQINNIQNAQYVEKEGKQELFGMLFLILLFLGIVVGLIYMGSGALQNSTNSLWM